MIDLNTGVHYRYDRLEQGPSIFGNMLASCVLALHFKVLPLPPQASFQPFFLSSFPSLQMPPDLGYSGAAAQNSFLDDIRIEIDDRQAERMPRAVSGLSQLPIQHPLNFLVA